MIRISLIKRFQRFGHSLLLHINIDGLQKKGESDDYKSLNREDEEIPKTKFNVG